MAQRRMFSPDIVESDAFLEMPSSTQSLYFHLGMYADDDGFVNPKKIMRMLGTGDDDLKVLIAKRFLLPFKSGVVVVKHWRINNLIRKDWYRPTQYIDEKKRLEIKENGAYTEKDKFVNESLPSSLTQISSDQFRIDKRSSAVAIAPLWVLEDKLKEMEAEPNSYLDIIATFIREKPITIENGKQLSAVIARYCRVAKRLAGAYTNKQIFDAVGRIKVDNTERKRKGSEQIDYTLETVWKYLTK